MRRHRLARNLVVAHRKFVNDVCGHRGGRFQVFLQNVVVGVHVGVRRVRVVALHIVANPLKSRQINFVKGRVISGKAREGQRGGTQVLEGLEQRAEDRPGRLVALQI